MSENYRWYVRKMVELQVTREIDPQHLRHEMEAILEVVRECEAIWELEDRLGSDR